MPHTGGLRTEIYCLTALEAKGLRSRWRQGQPPSETCRGGSFLASSQLLVVAGSSWCSLTCRCSTLIPPLSSRDILPTLVSPPVSKFPSTYKDSSHWISSHPNPVWSHLNLTTSAKTLLPKTGHSYKHWGLGLQYLFSGDTIQPIVGTNLCKFGPKIWEGMWLWLRG